MSDVDLPDPGSPAPPSPPARSDCASDADPAEGEELAALGVTDVCSPPPVAEPDLAGKLAALRRTASRLALSPR